MSTEILKHLSAPASPRPWSIVAGESGEGVIGDANGVEIAAASMGDCVAIVEAVNERDAARSEVARLTAEVEAMREVVASEHKKARDEAVSLIRDMTEALKMSEEDNGRLTGVVVDMEMCLREAIRVHGDGAMSAPLMRGVRVLQALDALRARKVGG